MTEAEIIHQHCHVVSVIAKHTCVLMVAQWSVAMHKLVEQDDGRLKYAVSLYVGTYSKALTSVVMLSFPVGSSFTCHGSCHHSPMQGT